MILSRVDLILISRFLKSGTILPFAQQQQPASRWLRHPDRALHTSMVHRFLDARDKDHEKKERQLVVHQGEYFDNATKAKNKTTFIEVIQFYLRKNNIYRRGHVEFMYAALDRMKDFGTNRDLDTYKQLLEIFPKGKMVPQNAWQVEMMHYPKQQQCCIDILDQMEENGVIPDDELGYQLKGIFGDKSHAFRKYRRMMYWMPKFRFANPYFVPYNLPEDRIELSKLALQRMSVDLQNDISVFMSNELPLATDHTYIVSSQSPHQTRLIQQHPVEKPVFVEGGYNVWLRSASLSYFVLRSDCTDNYAQFQTTKELAAKKIDTFQWSMFEEEKPQSLVIPPSVHEQEDGTVLAMCITGTSSKDSLASWVKFLERKNPKLAEVPVIFLLRTPEAELEVVNQAEKKSDVAR